MDGPVIEGFPPWQDQFFAELRRRQWSVALVASVTAGTLAIAGCANRDTVPVADAPSPAPAPAGPGAPASVVAATAETQPVPNQEDAADDPAIWVDPQDPSRSLVIGTDKDGGIAVYDLSGAELQYLPDGDMNNVDVRDGFALGGETATLVTASNRSRNAIAVYRLDPSGRRLEDVAARSIQTGIDVYGECMYQNAELDTTYVVVNSEDGEVEQWELFARGDRVDARLVRSFDVGSAVEGCVADDELGWLYVGEEEVGIWRYGAEPEDGDDRTQVDRAGAGNIVADVEGLAIAYDGPSGHLVASSQGDNSFTLYRRDGNNEFLGRFRIGDGSGVDDVEDTDGIDVTTANLGPAFPGGLFVAQDGSNDDGNQNYKFVSWADVVGTG